MLESVREGWVRLMARYEWDVFATLTWRRPVGPVVVPRNIRHWIACWSRMTLEGRGLAYKDDLNRWRGPWASAIRKGRVRPVYVAGIEPHKSGRLHAHLMIRFPDRLPDWSRRDGWSEWFRLYGRAQLQTPKSQGDVAAYCSKYTCKPGCSLSLSDSFVAGSMAVDSSASS